MLLASAAGEAAAANVFANLPAVADQWAGETRAWVMELVYAIEDLATITRETIGRGEPREPLAAER